MSRRLAACIAAKDEEATIVQLISGLRQFGFAAIVVNDGSIDGTGQLAAGAGALVIENQSPTGIAAAYNSAWRAALSAGSDRILQLDAGGSHSPLDAVDMLQADCDMVIGSRFMSGASYIGSPTRAAMSRLAAVMCNAVTLGAKYSDWTSGFRLFKADALRRLVDAPYYAKMHGWQIEVLYHAHRSGMTIAETPIMYIAGRSSFNFSVAREAFNVWRLMKNKKL